MSSVTTRRLNTISTTITTPAAAGTGMGSVILAAVAAVGAAAVVLQLGGCASTDVASSDAPVVAEDTSWNSPNYREGWYFDDAPATEVAGATVESASYASVEPVVTVETTASVVATSVADSSAVRTSLFPEFSTVGASVEVSSGDVNLTQVSFAAEGSDFDPDLSPDGNWLVFASTQHQEQSDLYRKSVDGRVVTQLTSDAAQDVMPEISPDGRRVAFASDRHGNWDVFVMSAEGGPVTQITFDDAQELHPTWSPDGEHLCYCRFNDRTGQWELWTLSVDKPTSCSFVCEGMFPRWSPETGRDRILFQRSRKRGERLYGVWTIDLVDGDGVNPTEIVAAGDAAIMHPTWSPDGSRIAYTTVSDPSVSADGMPVECDIWSIAADGTGRVALTAGGFRNLRPCWGADERVYFVSNRGGHDVIWAVSTREPSFSDPAAVATVPVATPATPVVTVSDDHGSHGDAHGDVHGDPHAPTSTVAGAGGHEDDEH